jgi:RHS repeat-associated protein
VSAVAGTINSTFTYDANGNLSTGLGRGYAWYSFNKPNQISQGSVYQNFLYDTEHARFWKAAPEGGTLYFDAFGVHSELLLSSSSTVATRYFHTDNLGSISVITNETGAVVERDGYDAWGQRRWANGADGNPGASQTPRGFTGQEELSDVGLVHLNGRIYDPLLARMTSADPMVPDPLNGQAWDRYSYVVNNPLAFTDPSGYCFLGLCGLGNFFTDFFKDIQHLLRDVPIVGTIVEVAAAAICLGAIVCAVTAAFLSTTAVSGLETGSFKLGLRAGLIAAATAVAFWEVGNLTNAVAGADPNGPHIAPQFGTPAYAFNVVAHAAVGCASAVASGGKCGPSALAGGVTLAAGPVINGNGFFFGLVANTTLGGGAAVLGGGKFENGAITGAFGYLFNFFSGGWSSGHHDYDYKDYICNTSEAGCTASNVFDGLLRNAYPGQPDDTVVQSGQNYLVPGAGWINIDVDSENLSIFNFTNMGHIFFGGYVSRWVEQDGSDIYVHTFGVGDNSSVFNAAENWAAGQAGFSASTDKIILYTYYLGLGRNAPGAAWPRP